MTARFTPPDDWPFGQRDRGDETRTPPGMRVRIVRADGSRWEATLPAPATGPGWTAMEAARLCFQRWQYQTGALSEHTAETRRLLWMRWACARDLYGR